MSHIADFAVRSSESELMTFYFPVADNCRDKCSFFISGNYVPFLGIFLCYLFLVNLNPSVSQLEARCLNHF